MLLHHVRLHLHWHHLHVLRHRTHLLLDGLDERRLIHWNAMLALELITVVDKKRFITGKFFLDGIQWYLAYCLLNLECFEGT